MGNQSVKTMDPAKNKKKIRLTKVLKRFEMCPAGHRSANINNKDVPDSPQRPDRRIYHVKPEDPSPVPSAKPKDSEWFDVPLDVPESPPRYIQNTTASPINSETPKAPPRKHSRKKITLVEASPNPRNENTDMKPVEEPIIIPKKEPIHICDGTHSHVSNYHNGASHKHKEIKQEKQILENEPNLLRQKTISVVSLPDFKQLSTQPIENEAKYAKEKLKSNKMRNVSVASLPNENKISFSAATAERLENYITKCKSFGSLRSQQVMDKLNIQEVNQETDSDDSWDGLDDWDLAVIEDDSNRSPKIPPYVPKSTLDSKTRELPVTVKNNPSTEETKHWNPHRIDEIEERNISPLLKNPRLSIVKESQRRRESIDDFFTNTADTDTLNHQEINELIKNSQVSRRGSEVIHGYDTKCYPFKAHIADPSFNSDSFFSSALIENESHLNNPHFPFKNTAKDNDENHVPENIIHRRSIDNSPQKIARRRSGSVNTDEIISHLQGINESRIYDEANDIKKNSVEVLKSRPSVSKEANDHSNLLKIINENPLNEIPSPSKQMFESSNLSERGESHNFLPKDTVENISTPNIDQGLVHSRM